MKGIGHSPTSILQRKNGVCIDKSPACYGIRASKVIYDRKHSAITEYDFSQVDLDALLDGFDWLHLSGITPALAPTAAASSSTCARPPRRRA